MGVRGIKKWCMIIMMIHIWSWVYATSRPLVSNQDYLHQGTIRPQAIQHNYMRAIFTPKEINNEKEEREAIRKSKRIGSKPPSCEKKCYGCEPCEAIQVPTSSSSLYHLTIHNFANYLPEGWRCVCSP